jgi:hypothetical protein
MNCKIGSFPDPYVAALAICNDLDGCAGRLQFGELHQFLNTSKTTRYGDGLCLDIGDSFWVYGPDGTFSYCRNWSKNRSDDAGFIKECIQRGWIDVLHSFGDFSHAGPPPSRELCLQALDLLEQDSIKIHVWTDHGNQRNLQNFRLQGADPKSVVYHADHTLKYGIRYVWRSDLTSAIGQTGEWIQGLRSLAPRVLRKLRKMATQGIKGNALGELTQSTRNVLGNRLTWDLHLPDGQKIQAFQRFHSVRENVWAKAGPEGLVLDLAQSNLNRLIAQRSAAIVYVHMYKQPVLSPDVVSSLKSLAEFHHSGKLWVTGTGRLLRYMYMVRTTAAILEPDSKNIRIENELNISASELAGLTIFCPVHEIRSVMYKGKMMPFRCVPTNGVNRIHVCIH